MTAKCPVCNQTLKPTATARRAARKAAESDFDTGRCNCGAQVLAGWADAQLRTLDAAPLNQIGELAAQALGLPTFTRHGARFRLRSTIERRRFPDRPNTVHAAHRCAQHWPEQLLLPMARHDKPNTPTNPELSDRNIPF
ncbi:MAG TPA: hypothetical protein PKG94_17960 [Gordonia sp. (in: high G+C Gram-positive bacteria)]|nr:hypothetical protein [Gordonia sp. (in: high G+C Gram-positive bacteria)]